jgi:hypothetical protein
LEQKKNPNFLAFWRAVGRQGQPDKKAKGKPFNLKQTRENLFNLQPCCIAAKFNIERN